MYLGDQPIRQKQPPFISRAWRQSAKGKPCTLNLVGCNHDPETTVLCHLRLFSQAGLGAKPHDCCAVYGCSACHEKLDRTTLWEWEDLLLALMKTLAFHVAEGRIK